MSSNLKLGSNWKSCGIGIDMRRWAHGNPRINFGWCKGDDNFGGRQRKELDDFTKSLGKQMNLVMYRMQDTENVRMRLREESRRRVREKFEKEERDEKLKEERIERNKKWRQKKEGKEILEDDEKELDENEKRKLKNKEWRLKRESPNGSIDEKENDSSSGPRLLDLVLVQLQCVICQQEMAPPLIIQQCASGHNLCATCTQSEDVKTCPLCSSELVGPNTALMKVAELVFGEKYKFEEMADDDSFDITVKPVFEEEESIDFKEPALDSLKEVKNLENI